MGLGPSCSSPARRDLLASDRLNKGLSSDTQRTDHDATLSPPSVLVLKQTDDAESRVISVGDAKYNFVVRVVLSKRRLEILVEVWVETLERPENRDAWRLAVAEAGRRDSAGLLCLAIADASGGRTTSAAKTRQITFSSSVTDATEKPKNAMQLIMRYQARMMPARTVQSEEVRSSSHSDEGGDNEEVGEAAGTRA